MRDLTTSLDPRLVAIVRLAFDVLPVRFKPLSFDAYLSTLVMTLVHRRGVILMHQRDGGAVGFDMVGAASPDTMRRAVYLAKKMGFAFIFTYASTPRIARFLSNIGCQLLDAETGLFGVRLNNGLGTSRKHYQHARDDVCYVPAMADRPALAGC